MLQEVEWGEFKVSDLFDIQNTNSFNTDVLVSGNEYDYVTRTSLNQGVLQETGFVNLENINSAGTWSLGLLQMDFFYRQKPWYAGQFVRKIIPKIELTEKSILFFTALLNKLKKRLLSVLVRDVDNIFLTSAISLPIKNNDIDFSFIDKFIAELEAERLAELEAYLSITGLKDYELTEEEQNALEDYDKIEWTEYNLEKLFGKSTRGKRLKSEDRLPGHLPFVTAGEAEEGVSAFIGNDVTVFSENTTTIDMFGSAKYRNYKYGGDDHVAIVHTENVPKYAAIFITSAIHKASHCGKFDYSKNFYAKDADELYISLPSVNGSIDFKIMEIISSAIHKLVIKDVVLHADKKIEATKEIINKK